MSPILRAILAILVSVMCFSVLNAMSKTLSQFYPVIEVIWARYFFAFLLMLALFLPRSGLNLFRFRNLGSQVVRIGHRERIRHRLSQQSAAPPPPNRG